MSGTRTPRAFPLALLVVFLVTSWSPQAVSQVTSGTYCPVGDGGTVTPPEGTERPYVDLAPVDVRMRITPTGSAQSTPAVEVGAHHTFLQAGLLNITVEIANLGTQDAPAEDQTQVRIRLAPTEGPTQTATRHVDAPTLTTNRTVHALFQINPGRALVHIEVNPAHTPAERCTDAVPNSACPDTNGIPQACTETYYANNLRTDGVLVARFPDLVVRSLTSSGPARATQGNAPASSATITVELENVGTVTAFNMSATDPAGATIHALLRIPGCACPDKLLTFDPIAPGGVRSAQTTMSVMGIPASFRAEVSIDPGAWVAEANETNNARSERFPIPTANLAARLDIDLPRDGDIYLLPAGHDLEFRVFVENNGDAIAAATNGAAPRSRVHRDSTGTIVHDERFTVPGNTSRSIDIREEAANLTDTHTYTISLDHGGEVLETREDDNVLTVTIAVAVYSGSLKVNAANTTVPPGVTGRIPFELKNTGSVRDTFTFQTATGARVTAANGTTVGTVTLAKGGTFQGHLERDIPATAAKGTSLETTLGAVSRGSGEATTSNVTFVVGDDTVAPTIALEQPSSGYLNGNEVILRIVDNVDVTLAEADLTGAFRPLTRTAPGSMLYKVDVSGRPAQFRLEVRATDAAGNVGEMTLQLVRDTTAPRISGVTFTPGQNVQPGDKISVVVEARDDNMDVVVASVTQPRPGGLFRENLTLPPQADRFVLREWVVPERPGHYFFVFTARDKAGNNATTFARLVVPGLDIRLVSDVPVASPRAPVEGQRVVLRYVVENTSPSFETGEFNIEFTVDFNRERVDGRQRMNLQPSERRFVDFIWTATPGKHSFSVAIDTRLEVAEADEPDLTDPNRHPGNNLAHADTAMVFGGSYPLFQDAGGESGVPGLGSRLLKHWYLPTLFLATAGLFAVAFWLGRRPVA